MKHLAPRLVWLISTLLGSRSFIRRWFPPVLLLVGGLASGPSLDAQPSFAGGFRGRLANGSDIVLSASKGSVGALYVLSYASRSLDVAEFTTGPDGSFSAVTPRGVRFSGRFQPGTVSGAYGGQGFSLSRISYFGPTQAFLGSYSGFLDDQIARNAQALILIATNQGELFLFVARGSSFDAGIGTLDSSGNFSVPTVGGDRYSSRLTIVNGSVSGKMSIAGYGNLPFVVVQARTAVLQNLSTRGHVGTGDSVLIVGLVVADFSKAVIVRALGPSLSAFGVTGVLSDPEIEVFDGLGRSVARNDNWAAEPTLTRIPTASGLTGLNPLEAGLMLTLDPGAYTVVLRGRAGATGNALAEVYEVR